MHIEIDDRYFINSDHHNVILRERKVHTEGKYEGKEYDVILGYYGSIRQALTALPTHVLLSQEVKTVAEYQDRMESILAGVRLPGGLK